MTDYMETPVNPGVDDGKCALCSCKILLKPEDDIESHRCRGCGYLICDGCHVNPNLPPRHLVVEHEDEF